MTQRKILIVLKRAIDPVKFSIDEKYAKPTKKTMALTELLFIKLILRVQTY